LTIEVLEEGKNILKKVTQEQAEKRGYVPISHDCNKELCHLCGIAYFEIANENEIMHTYLSRVADPVCICSTCRSNILAKENMRLMERFVESLWGSLWKNHDTPNIEYTSIECHMAKRELLTDVHELALLISKEL